jgi:polyhydroxyalkanoate synthase subunit PhaC
MASTPKSGKGKPAAAAAPAKAGAKAGAKPKAKAAKAPEKPAASPVPPKPAPKTAAKPAPGTAPKTASKPAPKAAPAPQAPPSPAPEPDLLRLIDPAQREMMETLSANLARAAVTVQGAIAEAALRSADRPAAMNLDPFHVTPALTEVMGALAAQPDRLMRAQAELFTNYMELWRNTTARISDGEVSPPVVEPPKGDKRFSDPDWSNNPMFDVMKQSYLLTSNFINGLVSEVETADPGDRRRVEMFTRLLTDAFSPSNFLMSNPAALRTLMETKGESILKGVENFAADMERGGGRLAISQTDMDQFEVGRNVATAPGKVVYQNDILQLLQFSPSTDEVHEIPLLIFPPWINKFYILDLRPENSMIRWLTEQGFTVFVASWVNPDATLADKTFEDYLLEGIVDATDQVMKQCGTTRVNTVGYCIGGTLLSCGLAYLAAKKDDRIASATFFAAQSDFAEAGDLKLFTDDAWLADLEKQMDAAGGFLPGRSMADTFNALRSNDLIWSFYVNNYLMGREPRPFDLLFWNSDQTRMPKALHLFYLRNFYKDNALAAGTLTMAGVKLDMKTVKTPVYIQSSKEDHIAPYRSVYRGAKLYGGPVTFTMAGSGHIAGVINHPAAGKYQHWTNDALPETADEWVARAKEAPGSWWPHWGQWLAEKSGEMVPARDPAKGVLKPIEDAPGSFVRVKS